jgi:hypothetical protein
MTNLLFLSELREICFHIYTSVSERFPDSKITAVGAFIFLRGFCPAIVSPQVYGISKAAPSKDAQRILTLVAKTIQNLANNVKFGKKEEYMAIMNEFIESKLPAVQEFLLSLAVQTTTILHINMSIQVAPPTTAVARTSKILEEQKNNYLRSIFGYTVRVFGKIHKNVLLLEYLILTIFSELRHQEAVL